MKVLFLVTSSSPRKERRVKVLTHQERFAVASSVNGKTSKKNMAHRVVPQCFSLKFYCLPTTPQQNALQVCLGLNIVIPW